MCRDRVVANAGSGNQNESQDSVERVNDTYKLRTQEYRVSETRRPGIGDGSH